jgi:hypothetical protein
MQRISVLSDWLLWLFWDVISFWWLYRISRFSPVFALLPLRAVFGVSVRRVAAMVHPIHGILRLISACIILSAVVR